MIHFDTVFGVLVRGGVTGGGNFDALLAHSSPVQAFGIECFCLNLDKFDPG